MNNILAILNGNESNFGQGAIVSVLSVVLVFAILAIIIALTYFAGSLINKYSKKEEIKSESSESACAEPAKPEIKDEDMAVAVLVASIDYRNQVKKDIKVISVKEIR